MLPQPGIAGTKQARLSIGVSVGVMILHNLRRYFEKLEVFKNRGFVLTPQGLNASDLVNLYSQQNSKIGGTKLDFPMSLKFRTSESATSASSHALARAAEESFILRPSSRSIGRSH